MIPNAVMENLNVQDKVCLVLYSGIYPVTFEFDNGEIYDLHKLHKLKMQ